jgi:hypothetical protein
MRPAELLATLTAKGVVLRPVPDGIAFEAPQGVLTAELKAELAAHKREVLAMLSGPADTARLDLAEAMVLIATAFEAVHVEYIEGALDMLDADADLAKRFSASEAAIDAAIKAGNASQLHAALAAHVEVIRECIRRTRAQRDVLPVGAGGAVGLGWPDGTVSWQA